MTTTRLLLPALVLLSACGGNPEPEAPAPGRQVIPVEGASPTAPYSPIVRAGGLVFLSGQIGIAPGGRGLVEGGVQAETRQALENVRRLLQTAGLAMTDVAKCTVFLEDIRDYQPMNQVYREFFPDAPPARTAVATGGLPAGARVEIECIAAAR